MNISSFHKLFLAAALVLSLAAQATPASASAAGAHPDRRVRPQGSVWDSSGAVNNRIIVKFRPSAAPAQRSAALRAQGLRPLRPLRLVGAEVVQAAPGQTARALRALRARPDVLYAEPDYRLRALGYGDEPRFGDQWGLHNTGQSVAGHPAGTPNVDIDAPQAAARTLGTPSTVVAVIDDGIDFSHPDLQGRQWVNPGEIPNNGVDDDRNGYVDDVNGWDFYNGDATVLDPLEGDAHGTHVAATIAANINGVGIAGVAPKVRLMALKFLGPQGGSVSDAVRAIEYAHSKGVKIANNSWGGGGESMALRDAINSSGMLFVAAAGNAGNSSAEYPAAYDSPNILSVAAADNRGRLASFSNYGADTVDIAAPGVDVLSAVPAVPNRPAAVLSVAGTGRALTAGFGIDEVAPDGARADFVRRALLAVGRTSEPVLLVDDDGSSSQPSIYPDVAPTIASAIQTATGSAPTTVDVADGFENGTGNGPSYDVMKGKVVVWATGWAFDSYSGPNLTTADRSNLTRFLGGGGKLVIAGMDAMLGIEGTYFTQFTLGLNVMTDAGVDAAGRTALRGKTGTAFSAGRYDASTGAYAVPEFHDVIAQRDPARTVVQLEWEGVAPRWQFWDGTSMATPHVTGAAALVASRNPRLTPLQLKQLLLATGKPLPATDGLTLTGKMVDAYSAVLGTDVRAPMITQPPVQTFAVGRLAAPTSVPVRISWAGSDGTGSGIARYQLQQSRNGGSWAAVALPTPTSTSVVAKLLPGSSYEFRVRAVDRQSNWSGWKVGPRFAVAEYNDSSPLIRYSAAWNQQTGGAQWYRAASTGAYRAYVAYTTVGGATAQLTFTGRNVAWIAPKYLNRGRAVVYVDGVRAATVDLYASRLLPARVLFTRSWTSAGTHTIRIQAVRLSGRPRTDVDAFLVLR